MKTDDRYFYWKKGEVYNFNKYFNTNEFSCRCKFESCKEQKISKEMIECLTKLREDVNEPLTVTSGFRCSEYQQHLRKSGANTVVAKKSSHEEGEAADVVPARMKIGFFEKIAAKYFDAIGIASNFLHLDTRRDKKNRRWNY